MLRELQRISNLFTNLLHSETPSGPLKLGQVQMFLLIALKNSGPSHACLNQLEIATAAGVAGEGKASRWLDDFDKQTGGCGWITREDHPTSRRDKIPKLTPKGQSVLTMWASYFGGEVL